MRAFEQCTARDVITAASVASAAVALQPIPAVDPVLLAPIQMAMVQGLARVYGHELDRRSILELLGTFGAGLATRHLVLAAVKLVPVAGWAMAAAMAYALTYAVGEACDLYFRAGRGASDDELREVFRATYDRVRREKQARATADTSLAERLRRLHEAFVAGLVTEDEYRAKKEELLRAL